jgi:hypothetical protein
MELRWIGLIALWTILSGPIFGAPNNSVSASRKAKAPTSAKLAKPARVPGGLQR